MADKLPNIALSDLADPKLYRLNNNFNLLQTQISTPAAAPSSSALYAASNNGFVLTTSFKDIPGCGLVLPAVGTWVIFGIFHFTGSAGDIGQVFNGALNVNGVDSPAGQAAVAVAVLASASEEGMYPQQWMYVAPKAGAAVKLRAKKFAGYGTSVADTNCSIMAIQVSP
jgi:hypothetical protein